MLYLEYTGAFPFIETGGLNERQLTDLYLRHLELGKGRGYFPVFFERESYLPDAYAYSYGVIDSVSKLFYRDERRYSCPKLPGTSPNACEYGSCSAAAPVQYYPKDIKEHYAKLRQAILERADSHDFHYWKKRIFEIYFLDRDTSPDEVKEHLDFLKLPPDSFYESLSATDSWKFDRSRYIQDWEDFALALLPIKNPYEAFAWFPIGGCNSNPMPEYHAAFAKHLCEEYGALPMTIHREYVEYYLPQPLYDIKAVKKASQEMLLMDFDYYEEIGPAASLIYGKHIWPMWWD